VAPLVMGPIAFVLMLVLCVTGMPIYVACGSVGVAGLVLLLGFDATLGIISSLPFAIYASYGLAIIALFYVMGELANASGVTEDAYRAAYILIGGVRGGLAMATTIGCAISAACLGSSVANAALFTRMAYPEMLKFKYDKSFSLGCIASAGTFAIMIPPSISLVTYGVITEESIGKLLMAGILPGILTASIYLVSIWVRCRLNPQLAPVPEIRFSLIQKIKASKMLWGVAALFVLVMGGIYGGFFTPTAGGAVGAFGALLLGLGRKKLTSKSALYRVMMNTATGVTTIGVLFIGGFFLARFLTLSGFVEVLVRFITVDLKVPPLAVIGLLSVMYLILGALMDEFTMTLCTMPFVYPLVKGLGFDGIWFGIVFNKLCQIGLIFPPIAMNLYVVAQAAGKETNVMDVIKGIWPFIALEIISLVILILVPDIALYLPNRMFSK
jgi:tripartite ATP-independent transporter DctM subunit